MERGRSHSPSSASPSCRGSLGVAALAVLVAGACAWDPWIPGEASWNPDIVVEPGDLSDQLPLGTRHVDELACFSRLCEKRFRLVVEEPGQLSVSLLPELDSQDDQARIVLEGIEGVLDRDATGRGPRTDVPALAVGESVDPGIYFVLIQSVGGRMPYQVTARLAPGPAPAGAPVVEAEAPAEPVPSEGPPARLVEADVAGDARAGYDPAVSFAELRTFRFPAPAASAGGGPAGAPLESPQDRQIRRYLADDLTLKGFRQAAGRERADLVVDFSQGATNRSYYGILPLYERYGFGATADGWVFGDRVETRGTLVVDIVDTRSQRIAWHASTTKGLGPGIVPGESTDALLREAVTEVLAGFPPR